VGTNSTLTRQSAVLGRQVSPSMPVHARPAGTNHRYRHSSANIPARNQTAAKTSLVQRSILMTLKQIYSANLSLTSALDKGRWSTPRPGRFTSEKNTRHPLYRRLGGPKGRFGWARKTSPHQDSIPDRPARLHVCAGLHTILSSHNNRPPLLFFLPYQLTLCPSSTSSTTGLSVTLKAASA